MESKEFFYAFGKLLYQIDGFYDDFAKKTGVKENLIWILYGLNDGKEHSQKELCESWSLHRSTVNTIMKELEKKGWVELLKIEGEKREMKIHLTPLGKEKSDLILEKIYQIEKACFSSIQENGELLLHLLKTIKENLKKGEISYEK